MKSQLSECNPALEGLQFINLREAAELFGLPVNDRGICVQLEKYCDKDYCSKKGIKPLVSYFKGKRRRFKPEDLEEFREQFKN